MDIIERIRKGDKEAIKQIYKENSKEVLEFAESITGDHDAALDVTKKTFVKLFSSIQKGNSPVNIRLDALKIAHDEACKVAIPESEELTSPYEDSKSEIGKLEKAVGHDEKDEAMGETRVISLPQEAINELVEDRSHEPMNIEDVGDEEIQAEATVHLPTDLIDREAKKSGYDGNYDDGYDDEYYEDDYYDDDNAKPRKKKRGGVFVVCLIINIILILLLIWFVVGLLINLSIIPEINIGYSWFNEHIANIF